MRNDRLEIDQQLGILTEVFDSFLKLNNYLKDLPQTEFLDPLAEANSIMRFSNGLDKIFEGHAELELEKLAKEIQQDLESAKLIANSASLLLSEFQMQLTNAIDSAKQDKKLQHLLCQKLVHLTLPKTKELTLATGEALPALNNLSSVAYTICQNINDSVFFTPTGAELGEIKEHLLAKFNKEFQSEYLNVFDRKKLSETIQEKLTRTCTQILRDAQQNQRKSAVFGTRTRTRRIVEKLINVAEYSIFGDSIKEIISNMLELSSKKDSALAICQSTIFHRKLTQSNDQSARNGASERLPSLCKP